MTTILKLLSLGALAGTLLPGVLFYFGAIEHSTVKLFALLATICWFAVTPLWMAGPSEASDELVVP